jgi:DNA polymerase-4
MRRILHIDMDAFFASVEQKRNPELIGKPVIIGGDGDPKKRGVVSTASYEARKFGIHSGMPLRTAYKLCPNAIFLPVDYEEYLKVSKLVKNILKDISSIMEDVGIDEAFLDITELERSSEDIAREIKERIKEKTGLTCSIGIGPNKLLAKIASDMQKPNGLTILSEKDIPDRLWPLPARKLIGVGPKTEAYLKELGVQTIGDIASLPIDTLIKHFGKSFGNYLYYASRGIDESPLITHWEPKSMSREITFQKDTNDWQFMAKTLSALVKELIADMKLSNYTGKTITVKVKYHDFKTVTRAKTLEDYSIDIDKIRKAAFECFSRIELKKKVRLIGLRIGKLKKG